MRITFLALCVCLTASTAFGAHLVFSQPRFEPAHSGDHGVYSVQDRAIGPTDPDLAKAYDNFSLANPVELNGVNWSGIWAEPLPGALSDIDFIVEIWNDASGIPDLAAGPILSKKYKGGNSIGQSGPDMNVFGTVDVSPATSTTVGGGPGAEYEGVLPGTVAGTFSGTTSLAAGNYWISIIGDQTFNNPAPVVDPEWQWHISNPGDGFFARDRTLDPAGTPEHGLLIDPGVFAGERHDLAFSLAGVVIPEPSAMLLALMSVLSIGLLRRRRA